MLFRRNNKVHSEHTGDHETIIQTSIIVWYYGYFASRVFYVIFLIIL